MDGAATRAEADDGVRSARLGVVAGRGALPRLVAEAVERSDAPNPFIVGLRGFAEEWIQERDHAVRGLGQVGGVFAALRAAGCRRVCFAGGLQRPSLLRLRIDLTGVRVLGRVARLLRQGDDALLRGLAEIFEEQGFELVAAQDLLGELLAPVGVLTARSPTPQDRDDIARAHAIVEALGPVDVGQGAVVAQGRALAVETVQGTDWMLERLDGERRRGGAAIPSGVLFKAPKPGQDMRMDVPAIGPETIRRAKAAGLNGVAVRAGGVFVLDVDATVAAADAAGLFICGWTPDP